MVIMIIAYFVHIKTLCVKILWLMLFDTINSNFEHKFRRDYDFSVQDY